MEPSDPKGSSAGGAEALAEGETVTAPAEAPEDGPRSPCAVRAVLASPRLLKRARAGAETRRGQQEGEDEAPKPVDALPLPAIYLSEVPFTEADRIALYCDQILRGCKTTSIFLESKMAPWKGEELPLFCPPALGA